MIALATVKDQSFMIQAMVVSFIALLATVGVYGLVALLVRMDDSGLYLIERAKTMEGQSAKLSRQTGTLLVNLLPKTIRLLGIVGTVAMLLVGGGMYVHNIEFIHHMLSWLPTLAADLSAGIVVGLLLFGVIHIPKRIKAIS